MAKTYLVTGGAGFIGSHLVEALVERGDEVIVYDNLSSGYERNLAPFRDRIRFIQADVRDEAALAKAMASVDFVFHEAALVSVFDSVERPLDNHAINLTGTLNILEAARAAGVRRLVMASTAAAYGNNPQLPKQETMRPEPASPYGAAKVASEYYLQIYAALYGVETVILRYFNVYGPRQDPGSMYSGVISKFADMLRKGATPTIFGDGLQTRDFVFVKDVVQGNLKAMDTPGVGRGEVFNIATSTETTLLHLLETMMELTGTHRDPLFKEARLGDIRFSVADISAARQHLGYEPRFDIRAGLEQLLGA